MQIIACLKFAPANMLGDEHDEKANIGGGAGVGYLELRCGTVF